MSILDTFLLTGKKAVVSGGARGIGATCAVALAEAGADVFILDLLDGSETVQKIRALGRASDCLKADLTNEEQVEAAFEQVAKAFGTIDLLLNNAGIAYCVPSENCSFAEWRKVLAIDLDAVFLVARAAGRIMIKNGGGAIVNTASMSGSIVNYPQEQAAYNAAKAGVIHLTKSLACEWNKYGIRVNCISPGYIISDMTPEDSRDDWKRVWLEMTPARRLGMQSELAGAVLYLLSPAASFTTGCEIKIDGGYTCY